MRSRLQNALIKGTPEYISFEEGEEFQRFSIHTMAEEEGHQLREGFCRSGNRHGERLQRRGGSSGHDPSRTQLIVAIFLFTNGIL